MLASCVRGGRCRARLLDGRTPPHCRRPTLLVGREAIA